MHDIQPGYDGVWCFDCDQPCTSDVLCDCCTDNMFEYMREEEGK